MDWVDLRSDTVTRPTAAMREAMMAAPLGDDVFGDDPTVNALQERIARALGFEAALFVPTGTQSNLCAILAHCQRGDENLVGQMAHCYRWEGGGGAVFGSIQPQPIAHQPDGTLAHTPTLLEQAGDAVAVAVCEGADKARRWYSMDWQTLAEAPRIS